MQIASKYKTGYELGNDLLQFNFLCLQTYDALGNELSSLAPATVDADWVSQAITDGLDFTGIEPEDGLRLSFSGPIKGRVHNCRNVAKNVDLVCIIFLKVEYRSTLCQHMAVIHIGMYLQNTFLLIKALAQHAESHKIDMICEACYAGVHCKV